jgi:hypothetical protein
LSEPFRLPNGVRTASTITALVFRAFVMGASSVRRATVPAPGFRTRGEREQALRGAEGARP